jgi:hypothetical protein
MKRVFIYFIKHNIRVKGFFYLEIIFFTLILKINISIRTSKTSKKLKTLTPKNKPKLPPIEASNDTISIAGDSSDNMYEREL